MMKINKKVLNVTLWSLTGVLMIVLLGFTGHQQSVKPCEGLEIRVVDHTGNFFIEPSDIRDLLNSKGSKIKGKAMNEIDLGQLERIVYTNPFVDRVEVYTGMNGFVYIDIWQRNPVIRVINNANEHFYIDEKGRYFPVTDKYTSHVIAANGFIADRPTQISIENARPFPGDTTMAPIIVQINEIAWFLKQNELWDAQIEQIYVDEQGDIELIPRVGNQSILLGSTIGLEKKMNNLMTFYREGVIRKGWEKYSVINLKYENQVICTKAGNRVNS